MPTRVACGDRVVEAPLGTYHMSAILGSTMSEYFLWAKRGTQGQGAPGGILDSVLDWIMPRKYPGHNH